MSLRAIIWGTAFIVCAGLACETVRKVTYPPEFRYMTRPAIHSSMWKIAERTRELDRVLTSSELEERKRSQEVIRLLSELDAITSDLDLGGVRTNHPEFEASLGRFRSDIATAKQEAGEEPPNYFMAGAIVGSCSYCHGR